MKQHDSDCRRIALGAGKFAVLTALAFSIQAAAGTVPSYSLTDAANNPASASRRSSEPLLLKQNDTATNRADTRRSKPQPGDHGVLKGAPNVLYSETFDACEAADPFPAPAPYPTPASMTVFNVDGRTPIASVAFVTDAWIVREDTITNDGNCAMISTSWYSPAGAADDWAGFPAAGAITPTAATRLSWRAFAPDQAYRDGYEVRYSTATNTPADFLANPPLLTVPQEEITWTERTLDLSSLVGTPIFLAFRNNSNDKFLLLIDDIVVEDVNSFDPALDSVGESPVSEYAVLPAFFNTSIDIAADVTNAGVMELSGVTVDADVLLDAGLDTMLSSTPIALAVGASANVALGTVALDQVGAWSVDAMVTATEGDEVPANSALSSDLITISSDEMSRFEGLATGTLSIGAGTPGELGHHFDLPQGALLTAARFSLDNDGDLNGLDISVNLRAWDDMAGAPGAVVETAFVSIPIDAAIGPLDLEVDLPDTELPAGRFVLTVVEPTEISMALQTTTTRFTPDAGWVFFNKAWGNSEDFGFSVTYKLAAVLGPPNDAPVAEDDGFSVDEDSVLNDSVTANDTESTDGGNLWTELTGPTNGALVLSANGDFTYTPNADFNGGDSFTYQLCDIDNDCDNATVTITVDPVNDVPVADDDAFNVNEDSSLIDSVAGNDVSPDGGNLWTELTGPTNGALVLSANGDFTYTPNADFNGSDSFTYQLCDIDNDCDDATVTITVDPINDLPVAEDDSLLFSPGDAVSGDVSGNDTPSPDGGNVWSVVTPPAAGTLDLQAAGTFDYTPPVGFSGIVTFDYQLCDIDNDCDGATVTLEILPIGIFSDGMEGPI